MPVGELAHFIDGGEARYNDRLVGAVLQGNGRKAGDTRVSADCKIRTRAFPGNGAFKALAEVILVQPEVRADDTVEAGVFRILVVDIESPLYLCEETELVLDTHRAGGNDGTARRLRVIVERIPVENGFVEWLSRPLCDLSPMVSQELPEAGIPAISAPGTKAAQDDAKRQFPPIAPAPEPEQLRRNPPAPRAHGVAVIHDLGRHRGCARNGLRAVDVRYLAHSAIGIAFRRGHTHPGFRIRPEGR